MSPGDRRKNIEAKVRAYLEAGVGEVLLIEQDGRLRWFSTGGEQPASRYGLALTLPD